MPCCQTVLSAATAASRTSSWLHRLHAKKGLSFRQPQPPLLLLPPPPPPPSSNHNPGPVVVKEPPPPNAAKPKQQPPHNPSWSNPSSSNSPQPQPQVTAVISDVFAIPSSIPPDTPALKAFRKQSRPRPRTDNQLAPAPLPSPRKDKKEKIPKAKKRSRANRAGVADGERCSWTDVTVIDTSTEGWKADKVLIHRGDVWKVRDKKPSAMSEHEDAIAKGKRRAGLVSKLQRDREKEKQKEKEATSSGNIDAGSDFVMNELDDPIQPNSEQILNVLKQNQKVRSAAILQSEARRIEAKNCIKTALSLHWD